MPLVSTPRRIVVLSALWTVVVLVFWLTALHLFMALLVPFTRWQWPRIARVEIIKTERDTHHGSYDKVAMMRGGTRRDVQMLKTEVAELSRNQTIWIIDTFYCNETRPPHVRLTPVRLVLEFPWPLGLACLLIIERIRRKKWGMVLEGVAPTLGPRMVLHDDFHMRAQRHKSTDSEER